MKRPSNHVLSPEAAEYLADLRSLPELEFAEKYERVSRALLRSQAFDTGRVLSDRFQKFGTTQMRKLPWSEDTYTRLEPSDLDPTPAPTPAQRRRVAAALATLMRDQNMRGEIALPNAESIRAVLTMDAETWALDIGALKGKVTHYDTVSPHVRHEETRRYLQSS